MKVKIHSFSWYSFTNQNKLRVQFKNKLECWVLDLELATSLIKILFESEKSNEITFQVKLSGDDDSTILEEFTVIN